MDNFVSEVQAVKFRHNYLINPNISIMMFSTEDISKALAHECEFEGGNSLHENKGLYDPLTSTDVRRVLEIIFLAAFNCVLSAVGAAANVVNIVVFIKQGFTDSVNISLCGLAVSDFGADVTLLWKCISVNPLFQYSNIHFDSAYDQYITAAWPHRCFFCITSWITAFITFERCLCVATPMKVKAIITPRRTLITVVAIFTSFFSIAYPVFFFIDSVPFFHSHRNKTIFRLSLTFTDHVYEHAVFAMNALVQISSIIFMLICTIVLIHNLKEKSNWRKQISQVNCSIRSDFTSRDKKIIKIIIFISCIFIACNFPIAVNTIMMIHFTPDYGAEGRYQNTYLLIWAVCNILEVINNSVPVLVYYNLSSKFRVTLNNLFSSKPTQKH